MKDGLNVAELFHGPTLTFKDLGLTIVAKMYDYFLEKRKRHMTVLVGEPVGMVGWTFMIICTGLSEKKLLSCEKVLPRFTWLVLIKTGPFFCKSLYRYFQKVEG